MENKRRRGQNSAPINQENMQQNYSGEPTPPKKEKASGEFNNLKLLFFTPFVVALFCAWQIKSAVGLLPSVLVTGITVALAVVLSIMFVLAFVAVKTNKTVSKVGTTVANVVLLLVFLFVGFFGIKINSTMGQMSSSAEKKADSVNVSHEVFNVLISGTDTRNDEIDTPSRSDVIMVATINPKSHKVQYTSLPRDTYYPLTCSGEYDKLTHASAKSMDCLETTVEDILGIEINYYVKANFSAVINMIDAVGGIDVEVDATFCGQDENDVKNAYCFTPGVTHMSGGQALSYARERHSFANGDYARAQHQQQVLSAFAQAVMSNPTSINQLFDISAQSVRTNMSTSELKSLLKIMSGSTDMETEGYTVQGTGSSVNIPSEGLYGTSVQVLNQDSLAEAKSKIEAASK